MAPGLSFAAGLAERRSTGAPCLPVESKNLTRFGAMRRGNERGCAGSSAHRCCGAASTTKDSLLSTAGGAWMPAGQGSAKCAFWESWRCAAQFFGVCCPRVPRQTAAMRLTPIIRRSQMFRRQSGDTLGACLAATATMIAPLNFVDLRTPNRILNQLSRVMKANAIDGSPPGRDRG